MSNLPRKRGWCFPGSRRILVFLFAAVIGTVIFVEFLSANAFEKSNEMAPFNARARASRLKALEIWREAADLQIEGRYEEALAKYREGLGYHEDPRVREHVWKLEDALAEMRARLAERNANARRQAAEIWREAAALQQAGWFEDALRKYREGLSIYEDTRVREHADKLERYIEQLRQRGDLPVLVERRIRPEPNDLGFIVLAPYPA